jgi:uncharacterized protein (TIGR00251 family)
MKIVVNVKPGSSKEKIEKNEEGFLVYVKEPPVEGKANRAVIKLLAKSLGVSREGIKILSGKKSKRKLIEIEDSFLSQ